MIQAPLTKETHHRIGAEELRRMKPTLILINTARGPIVNDAALYLALKEGWIAGADRETAAFAGERGAARHCRPLR
jgi:D-3-phosphoglycerate dehydrogenase